MNSIWIARDKDGWLCAFSEKPTRNEQESRWVLGATAKQFYYYPLSSTWFPQITWQDDPIELVIKKKED